jgi:hypothetical protein
MTKNLYRLWVALLIVSGGIALWFSGIALSGFWKFTRLNTKTTATVFKWQVRHLSSSRFAIEAEYRYEINGNIYESKTIFESPLFLNRYTAENHVKFFESRRWQTWYSEGSPHLSSLEREFPEKQCLHALVTVGVFAYFYFARPVLSKFREY